MNEVISGASQLKDVGIAVIIIVGFLVIAFRLIEKYPEWKKTETESKEKRARIYADALKQSSEKTAQALERMSSQTSEALEHLGERTELQSRLVERVIDTLERHHNELKQHTNDCRDCARNVEMLKERQRR